jgi:hypothetical protein
MPRLYGEFFWHIIWCMETVSNYESSSVHVKPHVEA